MTFSEEQKAKLKDLFELKVKLDVEEKELVKKKTMFNSELYEITGLPKNKPIDLNDLVLGLL